MGEADKLKGPDAILKRNEAAGVAELRAGAEQRQAIVEARYTVAKDKLKRALALEDVETRWVQLFRAAAPSATRPTLKLGAFSRLLRLFAGAVVGHGRLIHQMAALCCLQVRSFRHSTHLMRRYAAGRLPSLRDVCLG